MSITLELEPNKEEISGAKISWPASRLSDICEDTGSLECPWVTKEKLLLLLRENIGTITDRSSLLHWVLQVATQPTSRTNVLTMGKSVLVLEESTSGTKRDLTTKMKLPHSMHSWISMSSPSGKKDMNSKLVVIDTRLKKENPGRVFLMMIFSAFVSLSWNQNHSIVLLKEGRVPVPTEMCSMETNTPKEVPLRLPHSSKCSIKELTWLLGKSRIASLVRQRVSLELKYLIL